MTLNKAFALKATQYMIKNDITKYKLQKETGLTHTAIRGIFNEINQDLKFSTMVKIISALGVTVQEFFNDKLFDLENLDY